MKFFLLTWLSRVVFNCLEKQKKIKFRKIENIKKKIIKIESHLNFNEICINENLFPIYTNHIEV